VTTSSLVVAVSMEIPVAIHGERSRGNDTRGMICDDCYVSLDDRVSMYGGIEEKKMKSSDSVV